MGILDYFRQPPGLENLSPDQVATRYREDGSVLIDVRSEYEFNRAHIPGAVSLPLGSIHKVSHSYEKNSDIILICATGHRSRAAANSLIKNGFHRVSHLEGGMRSWRKANKSLEE